MILGAKSLGSGEGRIYPGAWPPERPFPIRAAANERVVWAEADAEDVASRIYPNFNAAFTALQPGETLLLAVNGPVPAGEVPLSCSAPGGSSYVVAVDTACMGRGDDALGATLMKGFLYALSQLEQLPRTILFYNGGAHLTVEGSDSLEDLKAMADRGVEILTCGTCLNFYGLTERLAVGGVTNMYTIVEKLSGADRVVKP